MLKCAGDCIRAGYGKVCAFVDDFAIKPWEWWVELFRDSFGYENEKKLVSDHWRNIDKWQDEEVEYEVEEIDYG